MTKTYCQYLDDYAWSLGFNTWNQLAATITESEKKKIKKYVKTVFKEDKNNARQLADTGVRNVP